MRFSKPLPSIGEGQVVRVGAHAQLASDAVAATSNSERSARNACASAITAAQRHTACRPSVVFCLAGPASRCPARRRRCRAGRGRRDDGAGPAADAGKTATYCLPSGPRYETGWPMIPEPVLNCQSSCAGLRVDGLEPAVHRAVEDDVAGGRRARRSTPGSPRSIAHAVFARDRIPRA